MTQDDFKQTVLSLKCGLNEREIDMFLGASSLFNSGKKELVDKKDFLGIFSQPLFNAFEKHDKRLLSEQEDGKDDKGVSDTYFDREDPTKMSTKDKGKVFDVTKESILENINKIKDKLERHMKRKNQNLKDLWKEISKGRDSLSPKKFCTKILSVDGLFITEAESQILYEYLDDQNHGKITYEDLAIRCKDINVNLLLTRFKDKLLKDEEAYMDVFDKFGTTYNDDLNARATYTMINIS